MTETRAHTEEVTLHPASQTKEAANRFASRIAPERLNEDRIRLIGTTQAKLKDLRRECLSLCSATQGLEPENVAQMINGLDVFIEHFLKLTERIDQTASGTQGNGGNGAPLFL